MHSQVNKVRKKNERPIVNKNGYFSSTLNSFQIGIIQEKQWAGDELLIFKEDPFPFSVVTTTVVDLLCITKSDLFTKFPKDIRELLENKAT